MLRFFIAGVAATLLCVTMKIDSRAAPAKSKAQPPAFANAEAILTWMNRYREEPSPDRLPDAVQAMSRLGLLRDIDNAGVYVGFAAGVLGNNPRAAEGLIERMFPMPPEEQGFVIRAIAYSGLSDWKGMMVKFVERMPARRNTIDKYLYGKGETLETLPLDQGAQAIDTMWGNYFATGSARPVERIFSALPWAAEKKDLAKLTVGGMAKWTLASNAMRDKELLDLCRAAMPGQPKDVAAQLKEVIAAAQEYEVGRIRKQAVASIDELRSKGPQVEKTWWTTALNTAPTAIGLACVAASVTGHVELGVPCIVSGALSTAAKNLWGNGTGP